MRKLLLPGFLALALAANAQTRPAARPAQPRPAAKASAKAGVKTLTIKEPCAVLYWPGYAKIDRLKRKYGEESFYLTAEHGQYANYEATQYLGKRKIKVIDTQASVFRFAPAAGPAIVIDRRSDKYGWGLILFDGRHAPREADLMAPDADVKAVFKK